MPIYTLTLLQKKTVAHQTLELVFEKPAGFHYLAGQYGGFTLINPTTTDERGNTRRFSLASAPDEPTLSVVTRVQQSAFKHNLQELPQGGQIKFAGPTGNFTLHDDANIPTVMIAGGIGIAPFYSMIRDTLNHHPARDITLFYGNQRLADTAYLTELTALSEKHPSFKCVLVLANPEPEWSGHIGYITDELIVKNAPQWEKSMIYVCGSPAMVNAMKVMLTELDVKEEQLRVEDFPGY